ncbi:MAG TPA: hypothetical protein VHY08_05480 [Bacillota bacterium]|nr:hypothetical protein [Bacillota bacterium]
MMKIDGDVITWLLDSDNPSVRYRTLTELFGKSNNDPEVIDTISKINDSEPVTSLLQKMYPEGYWLQKNPRTGEIVGQDVEYGSFGTTHFCLSYCAELGLNRSHPLIDLAAKRYLSLQKPDGDWYRHFSCLAGYNLRTFLMLGYRDDPSIQKSIDLILETERFDGGYLCDLHEGKKKTKPVKSCIRGAVKVLLAFSLLPEYWEHKRCRSLIDYFLRRDGIFHSKDQERFVNDDMNRSSFPITWRANTWEVLYALSKMGYGDDERLARAWTQVETKVDTQGRYILDWTSTESPWKVGKRGEANQWITLYILLAKKYRGIPILLTNR